MTDGPALRSVGETSLRGEWFLGVSIATSLTFIAFPELFQHLSEPLRFTLLFGWLFGVVLGSALSVVRHADYLAERLKEPYGTLILTLAITSIEVMAISAVMIHGENNPTLARDTLFAVVMIILNGMVGLSLLLGAWRRPEQQHNLQGANAYLGVIVPLATLSLVMPTFLAGPDGQHPSAPRQLILGVISVGLYSTFLFLQAGRHQDYFADDGNRRERRGRCEIRLGDSMDVRVPEARIVRSDQRRESPDELFAYHALDTDLDHPVALAEAGHLQIDECERRLVQRDVPWGARRRRRNSLDVHGFRMRFPDPSQ